MAKSTRPTGTTTRYAGPPTGYPGYGPRPEPVRRLTGSQRVYVVAIVVALAIGGLAYWLGTPERPPAGRVLWIAEKTTSTPGVLPDELRQHLVALSGGSGAALTAYAVGETAGEVDTVDLVFTRDGDPETDDRIREAGVRRRLDDLMTKMSAAGVGATGFSLYAALRAVADESAGLSGRLDVWLSTTLLTGSVDPLDLPKLTAADPRAAVEEAVQGALGDLDLSHVHLHPVIMTPVGDGQRAMNPATDSWRWGFVAELATRLGATVDRPRHEPSTAAPWENASRTPLVLPLPDPTRTVEPVRPEKPGVFVIDNVAFLGDKADLVDPAGTEARLAAVVAEYLRRAELDPDTPVTVVGYCARFGPADGARSLSARRAEVIGGLLTGRGVPAGAIHTEGHGFDEPADPNQPPTAPAQRVVVVTVGTGT